MDELAAGLWHWRTAHPEWEEGDGWPAQVSSYAWDDGTRLTLIDPLGVPADLVDVIDRRDTAIVLTAPWHERDTRDLVDRFDVPVFAPHPDSTDDLVHKFGVTPEQAGPGSPDLAWLLASGEHRVTLYRAGDTLRSGVLALPGSEHNDLLLWLDGPGAVVSGDTLVDLGDGATVWDESIGQRVSHAQVLARLRPLRDMPVQHLLLTHGGPNDPAALTPALG